MELYHVLDEEYVEVNIGDWVGVKQAEGIRQAYVVREVNEGFLIVDAPAVNEEGVEFKEEDVVLLRSIYDEEG